MPRNARVMWITCLLPLSLGACGGEAPPSALPAPALVAQELLSADRAFAAAAERTDVVSALTAMFAADVIMPVPPGTFASGLSEATAVLEADAAGRQSRAEWTPVRVGVSADGAHGFTFGYMTVHRPDSTRVPLKYLAYWVKGADGWKVAAYKRGRRAEGEVDTAVMAPALPSVARPLSGDSALIARHAESLAAAERSFSDEAQVVGLGPAFAKYGTPDAVNMGGPDVAAWVIGAEAIARRVGGGVEGPSPLSWGADRVLVASSGDLGITFGRIVRNAPADGAPDAGFPFFTIWRRSGPEVPWRYVAE